MKKLFIIAVAITAFSLGSCKKDRVCECTYIGSNGSSTSTTTIKKIKKSEAKTLCQNRTSTYSSSNGNNNTDVNTCKLK